MNNSIYKVASNIAKSLVAIKFKNREEYEEYKKNHEMRKDTKVEIEPETKKPNPPIPKEPPKFKIKDDGDDYTKSEKYLKHQKYLDALSKKAPNKYKKKMEEAMNVVARHQKNGLSLQDAVKKYYQENI